MNQRPTRAPAPDQYQYQPGIRGNAALADRDADFTVEPVRTNNLPAAREEQGGNEVAPAGEAQPPLPKTGCNELIAAIAGVMMEIKPVEKGGWNKFQSYAFARIQDLLVTITPLMGKHGIVVFQHEEGREMFDNGKAIAVRYRFTIVHKSGEVWFERPLQTGLSNCRNSKDGFDDKALNKCHTAARKYFLMSLFQIPTEDSEDADEEGGAPGGSKRPQGQPRRPAPSPSGKLPPHLLPVVEGEAPEAWAKRFTDFINKSESTAEIDKWYDVNVVVFDKLKRGGFMAVYEGLIDAMDARIAKHDGPQPAKDTASTFPADRPLKQGPYQEHVDDLDIPAALDRRTKKPAAEEISDKDRDWLMSLEEAFKECGDLETLSEEQRSRMAPSKESVSGTVWNKAMDILNARIEEING